MIIQIFLSLALTFIITAYHSIIGKAYNVYKQTDTENQPENAEVND